MLYNISMKDIKVKLVIIMPLILLVILIVSFSYAYLSKEVDTNNISMNTGDKYIGVFGDNKNNIELNNEYDFNIENRGSNDAGYSIYLYSDTDIELSKISYEITGDIEKTGVLDDKNELLVSNLLKTNDKKNIKIKLTYNENQFYKGKIKITTRTYFEQQDFDFTGKVETFIVPETGLYKLETWGAQGWNIRNQVGGYGAYSTGLVYLEKDQVIYIYVGGQGTGGICNNTLHKGWPNAYASCSDRVSYGGAGGGSSHVSTTKKLIQEMTNNAYKTELLIAAGGGGGATWSGVGSWWGYGGHGGGASGTRINGNGFSGGYPGTQNSGGSYGGNSNSTTNGTFGGTSTNGYGSGGGGGLYGGGASWGGGGGGGSGYIGNSKLTDKVMYCYNCEESKEESTKTVSTTCTKEEPTENCAKQGNGYARITYIGI